ncbi:hypothetical protein [Actinomycetospora cinnamomea]|uniref:Uncharacterized protein n=1 Tax=Actinomycetospora cinnamomea TaxID=663609 RepID=A0A2U1F2M5_9PSEU|nr:hypothetical protein [Actinomycetospora cinnamomea]PVZ06270.1 hypothetical protein C8D89_1138 [Actinomycetospora cinnamomea]
MTPHPPDDRYLSVSTLHEASAVLHGLARVLAGIEGVFADDAADDAARLRDLADALAGWWPLPAGARDGADTGPMSGQEWAELLAVYFARELREA